MSIPDATWECPPPKAGERPVTISEAARLTGHSRSCMTWLDRVIDRHPSVALALMALCCLMVCTADGWW